MQKDYLFSCYIIGNGSQTIKCGEILLNKKCKIKGIVTSLDKIKNWARENNILCIDAKSNYYLQIRDDTFDYLFSINYLSVIKKEVLELPQKMAINFHDAILPSYAGLNATSWAIMNNEKVHGITWHVMNDKVDEGDILKQKFVDISISETAFTLNLKCYKACVTAFEELISELILNTYVKTKQDIGKRSYYSKYKRPDKACLISLKSKAEEIYSFVRALNYGQSDNPLGVPLLKIKSKFFIIPSIRILDDSSDECDVIKQINEKHIIVSTSTKDILFGQLITMDGELQDLKLLQEELDLRVGDKLSSEVDFELGKNITNLYNISAKNEIYWVDIIKNLSNFSNMYNTFENNKELDVVSMKVKNGWNQNNQNEEDYIRCFEKQVEIIALSLIYTFGLEHFSCIINHPVISKEVANMEDLFSNNVIFDIDINKDDNLESVSKSIYFEFENIKNHITFCKTIWNRYKNTIDKELMELPVKITYSSYDVRIKKGFVINICDGYTSFLLQNSMLDKNLIQCFVKRYETYIQNIESRNFTY